MKTKEELNALSNEYKSLNAKLAELTGRRIGTSYRRDCARPYLLESPALSK